MLIIPMPQVWPFGTEVTADSLQEVWDAFVQPDQDAGNAQSVEMRHLMAVLRAVYSGLNAQKTATRTSVKVTPLYPGAFMSEEGATRLLETEELSELLKVAPNDTSWFALQVRVVDEERWVNQNTGEERWLGDHATRSYRIYVGEKLDAEDVRALPNAKEYDVLLRNMEYNDWTHVVHTRAGNFQPLEANDVLLSEEDLSGITPITEESTNER